MQNIKNLENQLNTLERDAGILNTKLSTERRKEIDISRRLEEHHKNLKRLQSEEQSLKREITKEELNQRRSRDNIRSFEKQLQQIERTVAQTERRLKSNR